MSSGILQHLQVVDNVCEVATPKYGTICIRLSAKEKKAFQEAAKLSDRKVSDWLRTLGRAKLRELGMAPDLDETKRKKE
jgi:predicted transcriptional regulator